MAEDVFSMNSLDDDVFSMKRLDDDVFSMNHLGDDVFSTHSADGMIFHNDFSADPADDDDDGKTKHDIKLNRQSSTYEVALDVAVVFWADHRKCETTTYSGGEDKRKVEVIVEYQHLKNVQSFVQEDKLLKEIKDAGTLHGMFKYINNTVEWWKSKKINVAVTGNSGCGKSSLINAIRGLKPKSSGAAPVGIRETTTQIQKYEFPESDKVILWDLPGMGTENFKQETYIDDMGLFKFDIVMVVTATRFLENDIWLAEHALSLGKNVIFVRTKLDFDLTNVSRDDPDNFDEIKCIETIRRDIEEQMNKRGVAELSDGMYLVSSPDRGKYDFPILVKKLKSLLNIKGIAICKLLQHYLEREMKAKREAVKREFTCRKVASAVYGFLPVPKLETALNNHTVARIREICLDKFSLDEESLSKASEELDLSVDSLKSFYLSAFNTEQLNNVEKLYSQTEEYRFSKFRRYSKYFVPVVGSVLSACKAPHTIQDCVDIICSIMAEDEYYLVQLRLEKLEKQLRPL